MRLLHIPVFLAFILILPFPAIAETQSTQSVIQPSVKTRDRASKAMNNLLHGPVGPYQTPTSSHEYRSEAEPTPHDAPSEPGKEIARVITGAWQIATFWCSDAETAATNNRSIKK